MAKGRGAYAKSKGSGKGAERGPSQTTLYQGGMSNKSAANPDASMRCSGGSVDANPTRGETAPTPRSLGPRSA
jgi:hypothetical protein